MAESNPQVRREVRYLGRVQGVGFRYTTCQVAGRYSVRGVVENLVDGSVRLIVEGELRPVADFLSDLAETMRRYIEETVVTENAPTGEFTGFGIRR